MIPGPPKSTLNDTLLPYTTVFRSSPDVRHYRAGEGVWPLRLSPYPCAARACRRSGQPVGGRAHLAAGGFKGAEETTEAPPALAWRRVVHLVAPAAPRACVVLRLCRGSDAQRTEVPDAQHHRRAQPGMPGDEIGRASWREKGWQYGEYSGVA